MTVTTRTPNSDMCFDIIRTANLDKARTFFQAQPSEATKRDKGGNSLVMVAIEHHKASAQPWVEFLVELEKSLGVAANRNGQNPLHMAAKHGSTELLAYLIPFYEHVDCIDSAAPAPPPLFLAATCGNASAVKLLLESGADIHGEWTAADCADCADEAGFAELGAKLRLVKEAKAAGAAVADVNALIAALILPSTVQVTGELTTLHEDDFAPPLVLVFDGALSDAHSAELNDIVAVPRVDGAVFAEVVDTLPVVFDHELVCFGVQAIVCDYDLAMEFFRRALLDGSADGRIFHDTYTGSPFFDHSNDLDRIDQYDD